MPASIQQLEALQAYLGSTPKPQDFNAFWQQRIAEAYAMPLRYRLAPSEIPGNDSCRFLDLWFEGIDGSQMYGKYICPNSLGPLPLVLQFHGYPGATRGWFEYASFAGMGYAHLSMDCGGQGGRSEDKGGYKGTTVSGHIVAGLDGPPEEMYYVRTFQNTCLLARIAAQLEGIDHNRIYVNGASQGGGLGLVCTALNPGIVKKAAILYPFLSDYRRVWELGADVIAYEGLRYYTRWFNPMGERDEEMFTKLGYIDVHHFAPMVQAEVLFGSGLRDEICPLETQYAVYNNLTCHKQHLLYPDFGHEEIQAFDDALFGFFAEGGDLS